MISLFQGSFPLSQQGEIASQQLWGRRLAGLESSTSLTLNFLLLKWHQKFVQVQEKKGEKYQALKTDGGRHTLQLVVSWRQGYQACDDDWGSPNKVSMKIVAIIQKIIFSHKLLIYAANNEAVRNPNVMV